MCKCVDVEFGSYDNQTVIDAPKHMLPRKNCLGDILSDQLCIDSCLLDEIKDLWSMGITTTGCCCGHNKLDGYIGVVGDDIPRMKEMGYMVHFNPSRPKAEDSFIPKTHPEYGYNAVVK